MGDITQPIKNTPKKDVTNSDTSKLIENDAGQNPMEDDAKFIERLEDWDSKNHQIITWLDNTSILAIHTQFDAFDTAKELWNFLATQFQSIGFAYYYQLHATIVSLNQEIGQSVNEFLATLQPT